MKARRMPPEAPAAKKTKVKGPAPVVGALSNADRQDEMAAAAPMVDDDLATLDMIEEQAPETGSADLDEGADLEAAIVEDVAEQAPEEVAAAVVDDKDVEGPKAEIVEQVAEEDPELIAEVVVEVEVTVDVVDEVMVDVAEADPELVAAVVACDTPLDEEEEQDVLVLAEEDPELLVEAVEAETPEQVVAEADELDGVAALFVEDEAVDGAEIEEEAAEEESPAEEAKDEQAAEDEGIVPAGPSEGTVREAAMTLKNRGRELDKLLSRLASLAVKAELGDTKAQAAIPSLVSVLNGAVFGLSDFSQNKARIIDEAGGSSAAVFAKGLGSRGSMAAMAWEMLQKPPMNFGQLPSMLVGALAPEAGSAMSEAAAYLPMLAVADTSAPTEETAEKVEAAVALAEVTQDEDALEAVEALEVDAPESQTTGASG